MTAQNVIEGQCESVTGPSPGPYLREMKSRTPTQFTRVEVLMRDGVAPSVQLFEQLPPPVVPEVVGIDPHPELDAEAVEIGTNRPGVRVAPVQAAVQTKFRTQHGLEYHRGNCPYQVVHALGVEVPAE